MKQVIGLPEDRNPLLDRAKGCPRCGGELQKTEHLDKGFDIVLEIRCNGCGYNKLVA
jgi:transcription elongation factor Elf1